MSSRTVTRDWRLLADMVIRRRTQLGMTQQDVQAAGGPATATLRNIEGAHQQSYRRVILSRLERALQWEPGSVDDILAGGLPTPLTVNHNTAQPSPPQPPRRRRTLGDVLVERGLRKPEELGISDKIVDDPVVEELLAADEFDDDFKDRWLSAYATMRREIFEDVRREKEKSREVE